MDEYIEDLLERRAADAEPLDDDPCPGGDDGVEL